jgi:hypothetical protein
MTQYLKTAAFAVAAFLAAWQATSFALDYRSVLGAVVAAGFGAASPTIKTALVEQPVD